MKTYPVDPDTSNFHNLSYYKLNKVLLSMIGQWSIQNTKFNVISRNLITIIISSMYIVVISKLVTTPITMDLISNLVPMTLALVTCTIKFYNHSYNKNEMIALFDHIKNDWQQIKLSNEIRIMHKYGKTTEQCMIIYTLYMYIGLLSFYFISLLPPILDVIAPLNKSRPRQQLLEAEHFVNPEEYFYPIFCHLALGGSTAMTLLIAIDIIFITYVQHACVLFAIAGTRLEYVLCNEKWVVHDNENLPDINSFQRKLAYCVEIHRKAIKFADRIEASFTWSLLAQMLLNIISISITLMRFISSLNEIGELVQNMMFVVAQLIHVFLSSYSGQRLIDHSTYITVAACNGNWYNMPVKSQKLLLLIIQRSMEPNILTAGKMCILSLVSFSMVLQSTLSYFTVLYSL